MQTKIIIQESVKFKYIIYQKYIIKNYNVIISGKNFYDQPIDFNIKWNEEKRKLTTGQVEDYTTGCLLDYDLIKIISILIDKN